MTLGEFQQYFEIDFRAELEAFQRGGLELCRAMGLDLPSGCPHHGVPSERAVPLTPAARRQNRTARFWQAWYVTTLLHEAVHSYDPEHEEEWLDVFGAHPLPLTPSGMGCWRVLSPHHLLRQRHLIEPDWPVVCDFVAKVCLPLLPKAGIDPIRLVQQVLHDKDFLSDHHYGPTLAKTLVAAFEERYEQT